MVVCNQCKREDLTEKELEVHIKYFHKKTQILGACPDCGSSLIMQEGCEYCPCGYSKC